jgi:preprotein translocase subunit SecG
MDAKFIIDIFVAIVAVLLITIVMMQGSKDDINDAFNGSKSELFKNQKTRGIELFLQRATAILAVLFIVLVVVSVAIHTR